MSSWLQTHGFMCVDHAMAVEEAGQGRHACYSRAAASAAAPALLACVHALPLCSVAALATLPSSKTEQEGNGGRRGSLLNNC